MEGTGKSGNSNYFNGPKPSTPILIQISSWDVVQTRGVSPHSVTPTLELGLGSGGSARAWRRLGRRAAVLPNLALCKPSLGDNRMMEIRSHFFCVIVWERVRFPSFARGRRGSPGSEADTAAPMRLQVVPA
jgi:hypothetical protein